MSRSTPASWDQGPLTECGDETEARWERAARQYTGPLRGFFTRRVPNPADVDDLVQDVFLQLLQRERNQGDDIQHLERYTFQTAANVLRDRGRRDQVRQRGAHDSLDEARHSLRNELTPERIVMGEEEMAMVLAVLRDLPERTRDVFVLRWTGRHAFPDIARMLGMSTRGAQRHMAAALKHLGRVLG